MRGYLLIASTQNVSDTQKYSILFSLLLLLFFLVKIVMGLINQELLLAREQSKNIQPPLFPACQTFFGSTWHILPYVLLTPLLCPCYLWGKPRRKCSNLCKVTVYKSQDFHPGSLVLVSGFWSPFCAIQDSNSITEAFNPIMILLRIREEGSSHHLLVYTECPEHAPLWGTSLWQGAQSCFCFFLKKDVYPLLRMPVSCNGFKHL